ncbi:MAG: alpha/beta hydrolase domain-containing protein [candidate division KSB1 bacterium]|nr:alpha/beta hydrolase domain-containing protein [candidate division KSB1 bacterium]MDQ7062827.1 alpha/beta hydrolase domain-containing protein [candidate division KSB1 bacterium]
MRRYYYGFLLMLIMPGMAAQAGVKRIEITSRTPVLDGRSFGEAGAYELLEGRAYFAFDPANPMNRRIVDLQRAPRNAEGQVEAWANLVVLKPVHQQKDAGVALVEVSNRGGKFSLRYFNRATRRQLDPASPEAFGNGLLMRRGVTVIWVGWQFDVPRRDAALRLHVPRARYPDGRPIYGLVRSDWTLDQPQRSLLISHRNHIPYPVADPDDPVNVLTVRDGRDAPRRVIPRHRWRFAREENGRLVPDSTHITLAGGFEAGKIYELVYRTKDPAVVGLGLAAIRDIIAYAKYDSTCPFPVRYGIAAGVSQTGRFLRHFLYQGFNTDEAGRQAYDGLMIITAGAGRGSFNHRFAQPSRDAHRYSAFFYPTDIFPFTSRTQFDSLQWRSDGLLAHMHNDRHRPKTFYINTGYEYWGRAASLIHTTVDGRADVEPLPNERIYHLASGQHFVGRFPPRAKISGPNVYRGNPLDFSVNYRALLIRLLEWVKDRKAPPDSRYPRIDRRTLVPIDRVQFPRIPKVAFPTVVHVAYRADYGSRWLEGIIDRQPPRLGRPFPSRVSQVDSLGNEIAGVRNVELRVPVATYTPWNLRIGFPAATHELTDFLGTFIPQPRTEAEKHRWRDPRPSLEALYASKQEYLQKVRQATLALVEEGFLLAEDVDYVVQRSSLVWDWIQKQDW